MSSVLKRASRQFLWQHPWQLVLAIVGIALGVAVVISIELAIDSSLKAFDQAGQAFTGTATHRILASAGGLDEKLYTRLRVEQGIQNMAPVVTGTVRTAKRSVDNFKLLGIDPFVEKPLQAVWRIQGSEQESFGLLRRLLVEPGTALISAQTAQSLHLKLNDELTIYSENAKRKLIIIGFLAASDAVSEQLFTRLIVTDIATAQETLKVAGRLSAIDVLADKNDTETLAKIREILPPNVLLVPVESQSQAMRDMTRAFTINLKALGLLSLLVGMFLIYNTMTFLVVQRRHLIGCLRSIGVTRAQVFRLILGEALLLATIGTVLGVLLGIVLGQGVLYLIADTINAIYFPIDSANLMISPGLIAKGAALGIGATLLAVLPPAYEATRLSPVRVIARSQLESEVRRLVKVAGLMSLVFLTGGAVLMEFSGRSISLGVGSVFLLLFGFALLTPVVTLLFMKLIERVAGRFSGILGQLPARMVGSEISRTGIAIAALMIAVSATIAMDLMIGSFRQTVADWVQTSLQADFYVSLSGEKMSADKAGAEQLLKSKLTSLADVEMLSTVLHTQVIADNQFTKVTVFELNSKSRQGFIFKAKAPKNLWNQFEQQQTVMVTEPYAYHHKINIGDNILLQTQRGKQAFKVIAIYADYSGDQGHLALSRQTYLRNWADLGYSGMGVYAKANADLKQLENQLNKLVTEQQTVSSERKIYIASMRVFEQTFSITQTLRWLSAVIAFIGVFNALMALQFERTRQLGILRVMGITPRQLTLLITSETGLMGLVAGCLAIPVGYVMAYILIFVIYRRSFGWTLSFNFESAVIYQGLALACIAAVLAGIFPALKMAQTKPAEALRTE